MALSFTRYMPQWYTPAPGRTARQRVPAGRARLRTAPGDRKRANSSRLLRFAVTGCLAGLVQLVLLTILVDRGWPSLGANAVAFLLAAQLNFGLSNLFTWRDRPAGRSLRRRWLLFHGSIAGMAILNMAVFAVGHLVLPTLIASAAGIGAAAIGNYLIGDKMVFRALPQHPPMARPAGKATRSAA